MASDLKYVPRVGKRCLYTETWQRRIGCGVSRSTYTKTYKDLQVGNAEGVCPNCGYPEFRIAKQNKSASNTRKKRFTQKGIEAIVYSMRRSFMLVPIQTRWIKKPVAPGRFQCAL
jgi:predicted nucleic-acid-binding Zn-ribbon protein